MVKGNIPIVCSAVSVVLLRWRQSLAQILLLRRTRPPAGVWCQVAGGIEANETAWQTALREVTEETGLNSFLERGNLDVVETDLGEYITQLAGEAPSHIVEPALHKSADEIGALFLDNHKLGDREFQEIENLVDEARSVLQSRGRLGR